MPERFVTVGEAMRRFEVGDPFELEDLYRDGHLPFPYHMEVWPASVFLEYEKLYQKAKRKGRNGHGN